MAAKKTIKSYKIYSADSHFTEPGDLWQRYTEAKYRDRAPRVVHQKDSDVLVADTAQMWPVGVMHGVRYKRGQIIPEGRYADIPASGFDPKIRVAEIEMDGVYGEVLYPTVAMKAFTFTDVGLEEACAKAYNTWAAEFQQADPQRYRSLGIIPLDNIEWGVQETLRCRDLGLRGVMIAMYPDDVAPYNDPVYDPFWRTASEAGLSVAFHIATTRRPKEDTRPRGGLASGHFPVQFAFTEMVFGGVFDRHPKLQVVSAENDAGWAANLIERCDYYAVKARSSKPLALKHDPSHYWRNHCSYTFMRDRSAMVAREMIGVDRLLWGSDFPHGDSTWPESKEMIEAIMQGVPENEQRLMLAENCKRLYGY